MATPPPTTSALATASTVLLVLATVLLVLGALMVVLPGPGVLLLLLAVPVGVVGLLLRLLAR